MPRFRAGRPWSTLGCDPACRSRRRRSRYVHAPYRGAVWPSCPPSRLRHADRRAFVLTGAAEAGSGQAPGVSRRVASRAGGSGSAVAPSVRPRHWPSVRFKFVLRRSQSHGQSPARDCGASAPRRPDARLEPFGHLAPARARARGLGERVASRAGEGGGGLECRPGVARGGPSERSREATARSLCAARWRETARSGSTSRLWA